MHLHVTIFHSRASQVDESDGSHVNVKLPYFIVCEFDDRIACHVFLVFFCHSFALSAEILIELKSNSQSAHPKLSCLTC